MTSLFPEQNEQSNAALVTIKAGMCDMLKQGKLIFKFLFNSCLFSLNLYSSFLLLKLNNNNNREW